MRLAIARVNEMWDAKVRDHNVALAAVRIWLRYLDGGPSVFGKVDNRVALAFVKEFIADARSHYNAHEWKLVELSVTVVMSQRLQVSATEEIIQTRKDR